MTKQSPSRICGASIAAFSVLAGFAGSLFGELLVHEPFDYERRQGYVSVDIPGVGIDGLNGGIGFSGPWARDVELGTLNAGIPEGPGDYKASTADPENTYGVGVGARTAPLSYTDANHNRLVTSGNQIRTAFGLRNWDRRPLATTIGQPGQSVWLSFLGQGHGLAGSSRYAFVELAGWGGANSVWIGNINNVSNGNWGLEAGAIRRDLGYPMNVPTLFLVRFDYSSDWEWTTMSVWLNPSDLTDETALPEPTLQVQATFRQFNLLGVAGRYSTDFDEIRIGTTFDSVTPTEFVPPVTEIPSLAIGRDGDVMAVSWPVTAVGFTLYSSQDLVSWTPVVEQPVVRGDNNVVEVTTGMDRLFFRLQQ
jgi:hypothetical protein